MSLDLFGSGFVMTMSKRNLGTVRVGFPNDKGICVYAFIKLYTFDLVFSELLAIELLP